MNQHIRALLHQVRRRYHPLHSLRKLRWFRSAILPSLDFPLPVPIGLRQAVWMRLLSHASIMLLAPDLEANIQKIVRLLLESPSFAEGAFYDVGANLGLYTWLAATVRPEMRILSFEPDPRNLALLRRTSRAWRLDNHKIIAAAVSDMEALREFVADHVTSATGALADDNPQFTELYFGDAGCRIQVQTVRLDSFGREFPPAIIKIDVEGHEEAVFRGAREMIAAHRPAIVYESFEHSARINTGLTQLGYLLFDGDRCSAVQVDTSNFIAIPEEKFDRELRAKLGQTGLFGLASEGRGDAAGTGRGVPGGSMKLTDEASPDIAALRRQMDAFYTSSTDYPAFQQPSCNPEEWTCVKEAIRQHLQTQQTCRVLEFGAGRTGFAADLGELRSVVRFTAQDVTPFNRDYLRDQADEVHIGEIDKLRGPFDVIFSTFVLEHISDPRRTLQTLVALLRPGGSLFLFCPRYDVPFYLSHSADHYSGLRRLLVAFYLCWKRLATLITRKPAFIVHGDPALLHMDWRMDRDAIHWASLIDLRMFFRKRGRVQMLAIHSGSAKDWCVKNFLRINLRFVRAAS